MAELKPCPFDGNKKVLLEEVDGLYAVMCPKCDCCGPIWDSKEQAIDAWNKRSK